MTSHLRHTSCPGDGSNRGLNSNISKGLSSSLYERAVELMAKFGAVPVTPRNMLKLLRAGEAVLLYPGGVKEALHQKVHAMFAIVHKLNQFHASAKLRVTRTLYRSTLTVKDVATNPIKHLDKIEFCSTDTTKRVI